MFIKMQDNEDFKKDTLGVVYIYQCEKCGKEKLKCKNDNEINNEFLDI
ncbi:catabolite protein activator [Bacillus thuringiensis]|nr:catabolite protein activator [Bacillus thuringiensis]